MKANWPAKPANCGFGLAMVAEIASTRLVAQQGQRLRRLLRMRVHGPFIHSRCNVAIEEGRQGS